MINNIIDAISEALNAEFGNEYEIYTESVKQGLTKPCFSIFSVNPTMNQFLGKRYFRQNQFCIHYFPSNETDAKSESNAVLERLFQCMEYITVNGDCTAGTNMNSEYDDGVLHFFVNFNFFVRKVDNEDITMNSYESTTDVKEG